jgi:L-iditol 2-dehydrogenase
MRAARLEARGTLVVCETAAPVLRPAHVIVKVGACGVCGTDRHIVHGDYSSAIPVTLGHEFAGTIVSAADNSLFAIGSVVAVDPNIACATCRWCRRGDTCLCPNRLALGVDLDGGLAEHVLVPESQVYPMPQGMPFELGALCEPLACCLRAVDLARITPGMSVAVIGGGVIGLLMVQLARLAGATRIALVTRQASRRALARHFGADLTCDPSSDDVVREVAGSTGMIPGGVDLAIECVGSAVTLEQCITIAGRGGTILVFGVAPPSERALVSPFDIFARELKIVGSFLNPLTHGRAVELAASGRLDLNSLITHRDEISDLPAMLTSVPRPGEVKAMVMF